MCITYIILNSLAEIKLGTITVGSLGLGAIAGYLRGVLVKVQ